MALAASPPAADTAAHNSQLSDKLDADIARVRAEIKSLTRRKQLLTSSLLSSTRIQSHITAHHGTQTGTSSGTTPLQSHIQQNQTNVHRLAYGVTSFPYTDPNPDTSNTPLLGIRFDLPSRSGKFENTPYYVFLKRLHEDEPNPNSETTPTFPNSNIDLKIHHHTIPALVPLQDYEAKYLPETTAPAQRSDQRRDEGYFSPSPLLEQDNDVEMQGHTSLTRITRQPASSSNGYSAQDLHAFVAAVRQDLISWRLRTDAIELLAERVGLSQSDGDAARFGGRYSLQSLGATGVDARFCRLVWQNGAVGRIRLTDDGYVDRAVVIGEMEDGKPDRMKDVERMLCAGKHGERLKIRDLSTRLEEIEIKMKSTVNAMNDDARDRDTDVDNTTMV